MRVSVVIPAYNRANRLLDAVDSVLRQGHDDVEIAALVDHGSTDNTRQVAEQFGTSVKHVHQAECRSWRCPQYRHSRRNEGIRCLPRLRRPLARLQTERSAGAVRARPSLGLVFSDFEIETPGQGSVPHGASIWTGRDSELSSNEASELARPDDKKAKPAPADSVDCWTGTNCTRQLLDELPILTSSVIVRRSALTDQTWYTERIALFEDWEFCSGREEHRRRIHCDSHYGQRREYRPWGGSPECSASTTQ